MKFEWLRNNNVKIILVVTIATILFGSVSFLSNKITFSDVNKNVNVVSNIIEYEKVEVFSNKVPKGLKKLLVEGKEGISFTDSLGNTKILESAVDEVTQVGTYVAATFNGVITAYGPDCKTCDGRGIVACKTREGKYHNLTNDGIYYEDRDFGKLRIVAAALAKFPCGTIVEVENSSLGTFTGIVLDTGYGMRKHLEDGIYHFDVAFETEKNPDIYKVSNMKGNIKYNILRWGW